MSGGLSNNKSFTKPCEAFDVDAASGFVLLYHDYLNKAMVFLDVRIHILKKPSLPVDLPLLRAKGVTIFCTWYSRDCQETGFFHVGGKMRGKVFLGKAPKT